MTKKEKYVYGELLRRYVTFHEGENMYKIDMWGLDYYSEVEPLIKKGLIKTDMNKSNKTIWFRPSEYVIEHILKPSYDEFLMNRIDHLNEDLEIYIIEK